MATTKTAPKPTTKPATFATAPNLMDEAAGSAVAEKTERQKSIHARLLRLLPEALAARSTIPAMSQAAQADLVWAVLGVIAGQNWRVYENNPMCCVCREKEAERNAEQSARLRIEAEEVEQRIREKRARAKAESDAQRLSGEADA